MGGTVAGGLDVQSLWGTVVISSVSGGIGSYIGGARSTEDILFGMATGAIVGALNHAMHVQSEDESEGDTSLEDMKKNPPKHPDYKSPKGGDRKVNHPRGKGWIDNKGKVWIPEDHNGNEAPHWDVQPRKGPGYEKVYPLSADPSMRDRIGQLVGLSGAALTIYIVISEGSRLFPPRNLIPVP